MVRRRNKWLDSAEYLIILSDYMRQIPLPPLAHVNSPEFGQPASKAHGAPGAVKIEAEEAITHEKAPKQFLEMASCTERKRGETRNTDSPLRDSQRTVVPRGIVEEHAMVVERHGLVERVVSVDEESVIRGDVDGWRRPGAVDADSATREKPIRVDVLDVGEVPPDLCEPCERVRRKRQKREDGTSHDFEREEEGGRVEERSGGMIRFMGGQMI